MGLSLNDRHDFTVTLSGTGISAIELIVFMDVGVSRINQKFYAASVVSVGGLTNCV